MSDSTGVTGLLAVASQLSNAVMSCIIMVVGGVARSTKTGGGHAFPVELRLGSFCT